MSNDPDDILVSAPEFVEGMMAADLEVMVGKTRPLSQILAELESEDD